MIVEPVTPAGAGLAVVYLRRRGPRVFDLTHNFDPEHATPFAPGSDVEVLIEVALPETGRVGFLRADSVEKIHRITGIYTPDEAMRGFRPAPPKLPVRRTCPEGMGTYRVEDAVAYPLVRPGETVVYDGMRREPIHGALCVLQWNNGSRSVLLTNQRPLGDSGDDSWCVDPVNRPPSREAAERRIVAGPPGAMLYASDGPYSADLLREKIVGTVVGILVPDRASVPQDEAPAVVADPATETLPAGEQDADPIFAAIERHIAARAACVGLDDREDEEGFEAAHDRATQALDAVESTQPTTVAGLLALARHMDRYLNEDAGGQNVVTPTAEGHAFVGLINACLGLADALDADADAPLTVENAAPLAFEAHTFDDPVGSPTEWTDRFAPHSMGLCIADKTLRMTKPELVAFIRGAAERGNGTDEIMFKALNAAQDTLEGWGKLLSVAAARYLVAASAMTVEDDAKAGRPGWGGVTMTNVLTFKPRPQPVAPEAPEIMSAADRRARLEEVLQNTLDAADSIIAVLDHWDGDPDLEPDADAEPSLAAPESHHGSQVAWMRGGDEDREAEAPEIVLPEVSRSPAPRVRSVPALAPASLPWGGNGNVLAAAGVALFALMAGEA